MASVAASSDGETKGEEDDNGGGEIVSKDDHRGLVHVNMVIVVILAQGHLRHHSQGMCLMHQEGGESQET